MDWIHARPVWSLCVLPVPWLPWLPVHHGVGLPRRRVQVLPRVRIPLPDSPDPVHQEDSALRRRRLLRTSSSPPPPLPSLPLTPTPYSPSILSLLLFPNHPGSAGPASPSRSSGRVSGALPVSCVVHGLFYFLKKQININNNNNERETIYTIKGKMNCKKDRTWDWHRT